MNPNTVLPIEVIYDLPPPNHRPRLCPNWKQALAEGTCDPPTHHVEDVEGRLNVVCPAGFWGISKVVERQAVDPSRLTEDPETRGIDFAVLPAPSAERSTLGGLAPVLFAASERIERGGTERAEAGLWRARKLTGGRIPPRHHVEELGDRG